MNIIVAGLGKIGLRLVELLSLEENHNITVIDTRASALQDVVHSYDVIGVAGNSASLDTLTEAGIKDADILIAVTGSDELNLLTCFIARKISKCDTIARVRNPEYAKELQLFKDDLGLAMIINPELSAATEIARTLSFPSAIKIDTFAKERVEIFKFAIKENSPLCDLRIADLSSRLDCDILVCGVEREDKAYIPDGNFILREGDFVSIVATFKKAVAFIKRIGLKTNKIKNTIIVGGGTTAVYLAKMLSKSGIQVKIIENNPQRSELLCSLLPEVSIINADGTENRTLSEEGIEKCEAFVALTNIDEENILLSLYAKTVSNAKIVTKINKINYDEVINSLGLDTIIYPKNLTAEQVIRFVRAKNNSLENNIETMHYIFDGKAEALEFRINENSPIVNKTIESLSLKKDIIIASINRNGSIITPRGKDTIVCGDTVIIVTTHKGLKDISDILE